MLDSTPPEAPVRQTPDDSTDFYFQGALPEPDDLSGLDAFFERVPTPERRQLSQGANAGRGESSARPGPVESHAAATQPVSGEPRRAVSETRSRLPSTPPGPPAERRGVPQSPCTTRDERSNSQRALASAESALLSEDDVVSFRGDSWTGEELQVESVLPAEALAFAESGESARAAHRSSVTLPVKQGRAAEEDTGGITGKVGDGMRAIARHLQVAARRPSESSLPLSARSPSRAGIPFSAPRAAEITTLSSSKEANGRVPDKGGSFGAARERNTLGSTAAMPRFYSPPDDGGFERHSTLAGSPMRSVIPPLDESGALNPAWVASNLDGQADAAHADAAHAEAEQADTVAPESSPEELLSACPEPAFPQAGVLRRPKRRARRSGSAKR